jgi:hypothetical protein
MDEERAQAIVEMYVAKAPPISLSEIAKGLEAKIVAHHLCGDTVEARRFAELLVMVRGLM